MMGVKVDRSQADAAREAWLLDGGRLSKRAGFSVSELGRRFHYGGDVWEIAGLFRRSGKFPIVCLHIASGELRRFSANLVRGCAPALGVVR